MPDTSSHLTPEEIASFKEQLETKQQRLEAQLSSFAAKDPRVEGDWDAQYPHSMSRGSLDLEEAADEVEEHSTNLPIEFSLETQLRDVKDALKRIGAGSYGICEKTGKQIPKERLQAYPEARTIN